MFKVGQQVVVRKPVVRSGPRTNEIRVGQITAMEGKRAIVTIPRPQGGMERKEIPISQLAPAEGVYKRSAVQFNPVRRQIAVQ